MGADAYKDAGVDMEAGYAVVDGIKKHVSRMTRPEVVGDWVASVAFALGAVPRPHSREWNRWGGTKPRLGMVCQHPQSESISWRCVPMTSPQSWCLSLFF